MVGKRAFIPLLAVAALAVVATAVAVGYVAYKSGWLKPTPTTYIGDSSTKTTIVETHNEHTTITTGDSNGQVTTPADNSKEAIQKSLEEGDEVVIYKETPPDDSDIPAEETQPSGVTIEKTEEKCIPEFFKVIGYNPEFITVKGTNREYLYLRVSYENVGNAEGTIYLSIIFYDPDGKTLHKYEGDQTLRSGEYREVYVLFPIKEDLKPGIYNVKVKLSNTCRIIEDCGLTLGYCDTTTIEKSTSIDLTPKLIYRITQDI